MCIDVMNVTTMCTRSGQLVLTMLSSLQSQFEVLDVTDIKSPRFNCENCFCLSYVFLKAQELNLPNDNRPFQ